MFEISLTHKSHILHACHEKANYMRVWHVALNSAESDSSNTISYSYYLIQPKTEHGYTLATNGRGAGYGTSNTDEMLSPREELVSAWQILESVKRNNRLSMRTQWEQSQEF